jgi:hypothetical protein
MFRRRDPSALHGISVKVFQLLSHHRIILDHLRMRALLPDLVFVGFMSGAVVSELVEQPLAAFEGKLLQNFGSREAF